MYTLADLFDTTNLILRDTYTVQIVESDLGASAIRQDSGYIKLKLKIIGGPYNRRAIWHCVPLIDKPNVMAFSEGWLKLLLFELGIKENFESIEMFPDKKGELLPQLHYIPFKVRIVIKQMGSYTVNVVSQIIETKGE